MYVFFFFYNLFKSIRSIPTIFFKKLESVRHELSLPCGNTTGKILLVTLVSSRKKDQYTKIFHPYTLKNVCVIVYNVQTMI